VTNLELETDAVKATIRDFDEAMEQFLGDDLDVPMDGDKPDPEAWADLIESDEDFIDEFYKIYEDEDLPQADEFTPEIADDAYLNMEIALPCEVEGLTFARVK
jgi:hypothetical protein